LDHIIYKRNKKYDLILEPGRLAAAHLIINENTENRNHSKLSH